MTKKTNFEYMVEAADFYRARNDEARKEIELLKAMLDEAKTVLSWEALEKMNSEIVRLRNALAYYKYKVDDGTVARKALEEKE